VSADDTQFADGAGLRTLGLPIEIAKPWVIFSWREGASLADAEPRPVRAYAADCATICLIILRASGEQVEEVALD